MGKGVIGVDEAGKGDYFGPLVIAGVLIDPASEDLFKSLNVRDSKLVSDKKALELAGNIKSAARYSVVVVNPEKYNELYLEFKNLNKLLAWGHARVIENILECSDCDYAISDKFGKDHRIKDALMEKGRQIELRQETGAERHMPVAAASIIARAAFLEALKDLSQKAGMDLPKGATHVEEAGRAFLARYGREKLGGFAKLHFKTTTKITQERMTV